MSTQPDLEPMPDVDGITDDDFRFIVERTLDPALGDHRWLDIVGKLLRHSERTSRALMQSRYLTRQHTHTSTTHSEDDDQ